MRAMNLQDGGDIVRALRRGSLALPTAPRTPGCLTAKEAREVLEPDDHIVEPEPASAPPSRLDG